MRRISCERSTHNDNSQLLKEWYKVFEEKYQNTVVAIYSSYKDAFERCGNLRSMELDDPEKGTKKNIGKKERKKRVEETERERDTTSGVKWYRLHQGASRFSSNCASARDASFLLNPFLWAPFVHLSLRNADTNLTKEIKCHYYF